MNTAIIAEYNPFHKGHLYHINKTRELGSQNIIAVMSGNFVQRGEPAIINKYLRTKSALLNGVDMVLELPVEYATSGADVFSFGACDIIKKSGIINSISFGCEQGSIEDFKDIAELLNNETDEFKSILKSEINKGVSYPSARAYSIEKVLNINTDFLNNSNNILALEYLKNLLGTDIKPIAIKRKTSSYNDTKLTGEISSATAIRNAILINDKSFLNSIPENITEFLNNPSISLDCFSDILHYVIRTKRTDIREYADITEGLENRIISLSKGQKISEFIDEIKTKRYTYSKIKRALLHIILGIKKSDQDMTGVRYIRVLGVKKDKLHLLASLTKKSEVPIITKVSNNKDLLKKEITASDIYNIKGNVGDEYRQPLIIL